MCIRDTFQFQLSNRIDGWRMDHPVSSSTNVSSLVQEGNGGCFGESRLSNGFSKGKVIETYSLNHNGCNGNIGCVVLFNYYTTTTTTLMRGELKLEKRQYS